jgi:hypothetical protein
MKNSERNLIDEVNVLLHEAGSSYEGIKLTGESKEALIKLSVELGTTAKQTAVALVMAQELSSKLALENRQE